MKLQRLLIRGFTRFTDPVEIDFSSLPENALIAIVGANGEGKTTILDAAPAALYRTFPSRGAKPLMDYAIAKNSRIEADFYHDERDYRAVISIDAVARKTDAVLLIGDGQSWKPINDGKVSTFDEAVASRFPPLATMLASVFAAQNKAGSFLTMDKGGRKALFASLLGLEHYEAMAQRARERSSETLAGESAAQAAIVVLEPRVAAEDSLQASLDAAVAERREEEMIRANLETIIAGHQTALTDAKAAVALLTDERRQADKLATKLEEAEKAVTEKTASNEQVKADQYQTIDGINAKFVQIRANYTAQLQTVRTMDVQASYERAVKSLRDRHAVAAGDKAQRIENNAALLSRAQEIRGAEVDRLRLTEDIQKRHTAIGTRELAIVAATLELANARRDVLALQDAEAVAAILATVPCEAKPPYDGCSLLGRATEAKAKIASLIAAPGAVARCKEAIESEQAAIETIRGHIEMFEGQLLAATAAAKLLPTLESAEERLKELQGDLDTLHANLKADIDHENSKLEQARTAKQEADEQLTAAIRKTDDECSAELRAANDAHAKRWRILSEALLAVVRHRDDLRERNALVAGVEQRWRDATAAVGDIERDLADDQLKLHDYTMAIGLRDAAIESSKAKLAEIATDREEIARLTERLEAHQRDRADYDVLAKCFGKDGLPVLEIDAAGPAVSDICNDLLRSCFGTGRFLVELVTQQAKTDKKGMKEVFDLKVYDNERGSEARDLTDLSGGEQVIVDEALKSAIALFVNQANDGQKMLTCWRDETTGALDTDNAVRYVSMLRRLQARGGFASVLFVTHNPAAAALADVRIVVADGKVTLA